MRAVYQRVRHASVRIDATTVASIDAGALVFLGVGQGDNAASAEWLARRIAHLRVFEDDGGKMNLSLEDIGGACLVVSQFTLYGNCTKGRRPSFARAAAPGDAEPLYARFVQTLRAMGLPVETGQFGADMQISLTNDGPVTLLLDTEKEL